MLNVNQIFKQSEAKLLVGCLARGHAAQHRNHPGSRYGCSVKDAFTFDNEVPLSY